jgi:Histidine kinase-, DNA gyrase B-, and HSP90-like ATPase
VEGPYRDLGSGFARLMGPEGARRNPSPLRYVEDALLELLRNSREAGASNIYVASTLKSRRYRTLTVIDDGRGIPETHTDLIFEPGVTSRHLQPLSDPNDPNVTSHGAGLALYHIKNVAISAEVLSPSSPTSIKTSFDTRSLPERALQSASRPSRSNFHATLQHFAQSSRPKLYLGSPARVLATLLHDHLIQKSGSASGLRDVAMGLGLEISLRTAQRVFRGDVEPVGAVRAGGGAIQTTEREGSGESGEGPLLVLGDEEKGAVADILRRAARASYLELEDLELEVRPGEISLKARVYEPEEDYE